MQNESRTSEQLLDRHFVVMDSQQFFIRPTLSQLKSRESRVPSPSTSHKIGGNSSRLANLIPALTPNAALGAGAGSSAKPFGSTTNLRLASAVDVATAAVATVTTSPAHHRKYNPHHHLHHQHHQHHLASQFTRATLLLNSNGGSGSGSIGGVNLKHGASSLHHTSQYDKQQLAKLLAMNRSSVIDSEFQFHRDITPQNNMSLETNEDISIEDVSGRKKRIFRPRRSKTVDKIIRVLEDKRVDDPSQLQDLRLPLIRKILNIIFVALGVGFLIAVIVVIIYTTLGSPT